jgi:tetratricopeptide (TPR) repeat protein
MTIFWDFNWTLVKLYMVVTLFFVFTCSSFSFAQEEVQGESEVNISPMRDSKIRELFQRGEYIEAESLYLKTENPDEYWIALFKMKQGKSVEAIELLKRQITKQETKEQKNNAILRASKIIADVSPKEAMSFLNGYVDDIVSNLDITCFCARYFIMSKDFDEAEKVIRKILSQIQNLPDTVNNNTTKNVENTVYLFVSQFYASDLPKEALASYDLVAEQYPKIRLDPGMQLLWARIAVQNAQGLEALKKVDWVMGTFPDYCTKNEHIVLITQAQCYEFIGDRNESKKILEKLDSLIKKNPKYQGLKSMVDGKLKEYRQDEAIKRRMEAVVEKAKNAIDGVEHSQSYWSTITRIVLCVLGLILVFLAVFRMIRKKFVYNE